MSRKAQQQPPKNFEDALAELEEILGEIESGQAGLEQSLLKYERGSFLIQHCRTILNKAEKQIELLSKNEQGQLQAEPLDEDADESDDANEDED